MPYIEALVTRRYDAGAVGQFLVKERYVVTARAAVARQSHDHEFGEVLERDRHDTAFGEVAARGSVGRQTWVAGVAVERDAYAGRDVPRFDYTFTVPGVFAQYDINVTPGLAISSSARLDVHSEYGTISACLRARASHPLDEPTVCGHWLLWADPITEETEA